MPTVFSLAWISIVQNQSGSDRVCEGVDCEPLKTANEFAQSTFNFILFNFILTGIGALLNGLAAILGLTSWKNWFRDKLRALMDMLKQAVISILCFLATPILANHRWWTGGAQGTCPCQANSGANDCPCAPQCVCSNSTSGNTRSNPNTGGSNSGSNANSNCFEHETPIASLEGLIANQRLSGAGAWVLTRTDASPDQLPFWTEINPLTDRIVKLKMTHDDGSETRIELVRPQSWLDEWCSRGRCG